MDFSNIPTPTLLKTWSNLKQGLDKVAKSLEDGSFNTPPARGAAPPSQAGQLTLAFAAAVDAELTKRKVQH